MAGIPLLADPVNPTDLVHKQYVDGANGLPLGPTGATAATRYVGGTTSGPPTSGTFAVGDFVIDQTGAIWVCAGAGTPGAWTKVGFVSPMTAKGDTIVGGAAATTNQATVALGATASTSGWSPTLGTAGTVIDGNDTTYVANLSTAPSGAIVQVDLGQTRTIVSWRILFLVTGAPPAFKLQSSPDTVTWTDQGSGTASGETGEIALVAAVAARYWRMILQATANGGMGVYSFEVRSGTVAGTAARQAVGTDDSLFIADSARSNGVRWGQPTKLAPTGLTGATAASRYVGGTVGGPPTSGTFAVNDFVVAQNGTLWICTVAGTPGTWTQVAASAPVKTLRLDATQAAVVATTATQQNLPFPAPAYDTLGGWNNTAKTWVVPRTGVYAIGVIARLEATPASEWFLTLTSSTTYPATVRGIDNYGPTNRFSALSGVFSFVAGETVNLGISAPVGTSLDMFSGITYATIAELAGVQGPQGYGIPTGGAVGQVVIKQSAADYDLAWSTPGSNYTGAKLRYMGAAVTLPVTTATRIPFDTEDWVVGVAHNTVTNNSRITITTPGKYRFFATVRVNNTAPARVGICVYKNGAQQHPDFEAYGGSAIYLAATAHLEDQCVAGDYYEVFVTSVGAATTTFSSAPAIHPEFWCERLDPPIGPTGPQGIQGPQGNPGAAINDPTTARGQLLVRDYQPNTVGVPATVPTSISGTGGSSTLSNVLDGNDATSGVLGNNGGVSTPTAFLQYDPSFPEPVGAWRLLASRALKLEGSSDGGSNFTVLDTHPGDGTTRAFPYLQGTVFRVTAADATAAATISTITFYRGTLGLVAVASAFSGAALMADPKTLVPTFQTPPLANNASQGDLSAANWTKLFNLYTPDNPSGSQTTTDLNALTKSGFYNAASGATGYPGTFGLYNWWHVEHIAHVNQSGYAVQIAYPLDAAGHFWAKRQQLANGWSAWRFYGDVPWTTLSVSYVTVTTAYQYRVVGDMVELRGNGVFSGVGDAAGWGFTANIPAITPVANRYMPLNKPFNTTSLLIQTAGQTVAISGGTSGSVPNGQMFSLDGVRYSL